MKRLIIVLTMLCILLLPTQTLANPYGLFGQGNCVKFAVDCMEAYWPMVPDINGGWDAYRWAELVGYQKDGYTIVKVTDPQPGDVFVTPNDKFNRYGHVGMVVGVAWSYDLEDKSKVTKITVIDSGMWADKVNFPWIYKGCRYREITYYSDWYGDSIFIRCVKIKQ